MKGGLRVNRFNDFLSPIGRLTMIINQDDELVRLSFDAARKYSQQAVCSGVYWKDLAPFEEVIARLSAYFDGQAPKATDLELNPQGASDFRLLTWQALLNVPYGDVTTYQQLADEVAKMQGRPSQSAQAIGNALRSNPLPIIIPCHRVITSDHRLGGYHGGQDHKAWLLRHEGVDVDSLL